MQVLKEDGKTGSGHDYLIYFEPSTCFNTANDRELIENVYQVFENFNT